jgi:DNA polymerase
LTVVAHIDFETRSACDLKKAGVHRYAEDPTTEILCLAWCVGDGPVRSWVPGAEDPTDLLNHILGFGIVAAHNIQFDRTIWNALAPKHWPRIDIVQTDCTMARASAMGLPPALGQLGQALGLKIQKDQEGARLMMQMCKPRKLHPDGRIDWWEDADRMARLVRYCVTDVEAEREIDLALPPLSASERRMYHLDQLINERGVAVDLKQAQRALAVVEEARKRANDRMWYLTDGEVTKCSEVAKLVGWLHGRGIACESVAKGEIEDIVLQTEMLGDDAAEEAIRLRRASSKTSTDKFKAMLASANVRDSRVRGTLAYHSAHTGRWAGRGIQPQNFPRVDPDRDLPDVLTALDVLAWNKKPDEVCTALEVLTGDVMGTLSKCLRATIVAGQNKMFVGGDFSNIEGRLNAWIAGEAWKLEAFREYDAGTGPDLYKLAYSRSFNVAIDKVSKADRQIGKVMELALGYQGGAGAFITMGANYGVRVTEERANELKVAWRTANSAITQSWWTLQDAAIAAVGTPGEKIEILDGKIIFLCQNGFLFCRLPSKRVISFAAPRLKVVEDSQGRNRYQVEYDGLDSQTKRWGPLRLYGGILCNNVVQGTARDVMAEAMLRAEVANYPVVLTVHDELLSEISYTTVPQADTFAAVMSELPVWAEGLPLAAAAWEDTRYVK